jgi:FkbM family methyltransferase
MKRSGQYWLPDDDNYFENVMDERGFQIDHLEKALKYVKNFTIGMDCGAHIGTWSVNMAKYFDKVVAFEAHPTVFGCLEKNIKDFDNIIAYNIAIGEKEQGVYINDDTGRAGNTGSRYVSTVNLKECSCLVSMHPLDNFNYDDVGFIKMDLEGYEYFALDGAFSTIISNRPVIMIEEKSFPGRYNISEKAASSKLIEFGAKCVDKIGKDYIFIFE